MVKNTFLFIFLLFTLACKNISDEYLKIGTNVWPGYEPLYLARELGYFDSEKIHLVEYTSSSQVIRGYRNSVINGAALTLDEVLLLRSFGFKPVVILVVDISNGADVLIAKPYIKSLADLKGKKIGVENSALGAYFLARILEIAGISKDDIKIVPLEVSEHYEAFVKNKVDAVITFEPVRSKLLQVGGKIIFDSSKIPYEIVDVVVVEKKFIEKFPHIVQKLVDGWFNALDFWKKNPKKALKIISEREKISQEQLKKAYSLMIIPDRHLSLFLMEKNRSVLISVARKLLSIMEKEKLIDKTVDISDLVNGEFVKNASR